MKRAGVLFFFVAMAMLCFISPLLGSARAEAFPGEPFTLDYGTHADAVTAGPEGAMWFIAIPSESGHRTLGKMTAAGEVTEERLAAGPWVVPTIASSPAGDLWFGEAHAIGRRTPAGGFMSYELPADASSPTAMTVGPEGDVWFTEGYASRIGRLDPGGHFTEFSLPPGANPAGSPSAPKGISGSPSGRSVRSGGSLPTA